MNNGINNFQNIYNYNTTSAPNYYSAYTPTNITQSPICVKPQNNPISGKETVSAMNKAHRLKKAVGKMISPIKKIRPKHIMPFAMFGLILFSRCSVGSATSNTPHQSSSAAMYEQAYQSGKQHVLDSLKIDMLEKELKIAKDSLKKVKLPK